MAHFERGVKVAFDFFFLSIPTKSHETASIALDFQIEISGYWINVAVYSDLDDVLKSFYFNSPSMHGIKFVDARGSLPRHLLLLYKPTG